MNQTLLLRREWFGGLLVTLPEATSTCLDAAGHAAKRAELLDGGPGRPAARLVDAAALGYPLREDALATPGTAYLEITRRCDGACSHCYANAGSGPGDDELPFRDIERLLRRLAALGAYYIRLTGGEPTQREDFFDIVDVIADEGMKPSLNTHGRYGEATLRRILDRGVRNIRISLDGPESVNDAIRGRGSYQGVLATLRRLADYNQSAQRPADPTINVVLMRSNRRWIGEMIELAASLGFRLSFGLLRPAGKAAVSEMLSPEEVLRAAWEVQQRRRAMGLRQGRVRTNFDVFCDPAGPATLGPFPFDNSKCQIGAWGLGVRADGHIIPCNYLGSMGERWLGEDVRSKDILDLWHHSAVLNEARRVRRRGCRGCPHRAVRCNGGCPATAYAVTGNLDGPDSYCVRDAALPASIDSSGQGG